MKKVFMNFLNLDLTTNLGVSKYCLALIGLFESAFDVYALIENRESLDSEIGREIASKVKLVLSVSEAKKIALYCQNSSVEVLVHHFKRGVLPVKRIVICHDMHVIDVPWKYEDIEKSTANMIISIERADAVVCHFPRIYYALERVFKINKQNLFLTPEILMIADQAPQKSQIDSTLNKFGLVGRQEKFLFYPAQLQRHKGHDALINAFSADVIRDNNLMLVFCGSDFDPDYTAELKAKIYHMGVGEYCKILGRIDEHDLVSLFEGCAGVIVPSRAEGGALVALEGIYFNKPVAINRIEAAEMHLNMYQAKCHWFNVDVQESVVSALLYLWRPDPDVDAHMHLDNVKARDLMVDEKRKAIIVDGWSRIINYLCTEEGRPFPCVDSNLNVIGYV